MMKNLEQIKPPDQVKKARYRELLREVPVAVNNFYGDPLIQWSDTSRKLDELAADQHAGPVGIITKGKLTADKIKPLAGWREQGLKIVVLNSISELPQFERAPMEQRYENIFLLNKAKIPAIAYIRPMTPPYNTDEKTIKKIFGRLDEVGAKYVVASGFRGDDNIVKDMSPDQKQEWVLRVKIMTKDVYELMKQQAEKFNMHLFTRTACGVAAALDQEKTYNPYYYSPGLVHCQDLDCPIQSTCRPATKPKPGSLELIGDLGYDAQIFQGDSQNKCRTTGENRLNCPSCCTTCYMLEVPRIEVKTKSINLGDLTFIRFITGMLTSQKNVNDDGAKDIGRVHLPKFPQIDQIQCLNSWWPFAHNADSCFDCVYCIEKYYKNNRKDFGFSPVKLMDKVNQYL